MQHDHDSRYTLKLPDITPVSHGGHNLKRVNKIHADYICTIIHKRLYVSVCACIHSVRLDNMETIPIDHVMIN